MERDRLLRRSGIAALLAAAGFLLAGGVARAEERTVVVFPVDAARGVPPGLVQMPEQEIGPDGRGYIDFALAPAPEGEELMVSVIFRDRADASLMADWEPLEGGEVTVVAAELAEGVRALNLRSFRLPADYAAAGGWLRIAGAAGDVLRVRFDWVAPVAVLVPLDQEIPGAILGGRVVDEAELTGSPPETPPDGWLGETLDAPLHDGILPLDKAVGLVAPLDSDGFLGLVRARFMGLSLGGRVPVWVNGRYLGEIQPEIPLLTDPGYVDTGRGTVAFAGWRSGSVLVPADVLRAGDNTIIFGASEPGVYLRGASLQLRRPDSRR